MTENDVKTAIIEYLQYTGWLVLRVNSGANVSNEQGKRHFFWFVKWFSLGRSPQTAGCADILAFKDGRYLAVETKRPGKRGNVTDAQWDFLRAWAEHGGAWCIAEHVDDVIVTIGKAVA